MAKWGDRHMYNWMGWIHKVYDIYDKINEWTVTPTSPPKFAIFTLNITVGSILLGLLTGLMLIPQTIEWIMKNLMDEVNKLGNNKDKGIKHNIKEFTYIMMALFVLLPYTITWGLPKLIMEKREEKMADTLEVDTLEVDNPNLVPVGNVEILWPYAPKDFNFKKKLKPHRMVEPIEPQSRGNYSIAFGSNSIARGYHTTGG